VPPPEVDLDYLSNEHNLPEADTGRWIFESVEYKKWRENSESKILWLCGGPGTGKTMLAKSIAAELAKGPCGHPGGVKLLSHFVLPEIPTEETSTDNPLARKFGLAKVASDLLHGILQQDESLFGSCKAELKTQGDRFFTNPSSLWKVLRKAIEKCHTDPICILIDGIDGLKPTLCGNLMVRALWLADIPKVKIFFSSRIVPVVCNNLCQHMQINLDGNDSIRGDVETFIRQKVDWLQWGEGQKERVRETLLAKAEGTLLWASLVVENLACHSSGPDFYAFLEGSPPGLEGVYQEMLRRIKERKGSKKVLDMIWCVALAVRPLTFDELGHILARIEGRAKSKQRSSRGGASTQSQPTEMEIMKAILSCQGFLRSVAGTVSMVHHTAIEYLFDEKRDDGLPICSKSEVDFIISWECFQYLHTAFDDVGEARKEDVREHNDKLRDSSPKREHQREDSGEIGWEVAHKRAHEAAAKHKYLRYAAESWFTHARRSIESSKPKDEFSSYETHNWLKYPFFQTGDTIRKFWIVLCGDPGMEVLAGEQTPLNIAVCLGIVPLVEEALMGSGGGSNITQSPLHLAAKSISGAYKILIAKSGRSLLMNQDRDGNTPLHQATIFGHSPMLKGLVEKFTGDTAYGKAINMKNNYGNTLLHLAVQFDYPDIFRFLVRNGADMTIPNDAGLTATELGKRLGRGEILDILKELQETQQRGSTEERVEERVEDLVEDPMGNRWEEPVVDPVDKPVEEPVEEPVESAGEPAGEQGRSWWRAQGRRLLVWSKRLWEDLWGAPGQNPGSVQGVCDRGDGRGKRSGIKRNRRHRTRSHHQTTPRQ